MAERRMFAKTIIDSDAFLDMPASARLLYYDLSMRADDDGFINSPKKIIRMTGASEDDIKILITKQFVIPFENGVVVIKHWFIHNYIRKDTYSETQYKEQKSLLTLDENKGYRLIDTVRGRPVDGSSTQVRIGKVSIVNTSSSTDSKDTIVETTTSKVTTPNKNDDEEKTIFDLVEQAFGRPLSPVEFEEISKWADTDLTRHAIRIAELNRATRISYIVTILRNYERNGIRSTSEAEEFDKKFQGKKNTCTISNSKIPEGHKIGDVIEKNGHTYLVTKDGEVLYDK